MVKDRWIWRYKDLFLTIERSTEGRSEYKIKARFEGRTEDADLDRPLSLEEIARLWEGKGRGFYAQEVGQRIYKAVFSRDVLELLTWAKRSLQPWEGLRLRFRAGAPEVSEWPLETLCDGKDFLALQKDRLIVRYQGEPRRMSVLWGPRPLRVLVVVSSPKGQEPLDVEREWKVIRDALEPLVRRKRVEVKRLDTPTPSVLTEELDKKYHVLHFIGHGAFNLSEGAGVIYLADNEGNALPLGGGVLAVLLGGHPSIRLVVLNTCEGALTRGDRFSGVAQALIHQEIPAVLAMQAKIPDSAAIRFSQRFYERLAKGRPIDRALRKVRYELFAAGVQDGDWAMPVLFLASKDGKLFTLLPSWQSMLLSLSLLSLILAVWFIKPWKPRCPTPKALDMEFVRIEPAPGSGITQPYCLGRYEVSRGEWRTLMGENSLPRGEEGGDELPAGVSESNTQKFIRKLNETEGKNVYRLPTDAEWEHAAMGQGKSLGGNCKSPDGYEGLAPVGTFRTNDWDLYDMVGNVWEWVDAPDATDKERVRRGGASDSSSENCQLTARKSLDGARNQQNTGFRVLRELPK